MAGLCCDQLNLPLGFNLIFIYFLDSLTNLLILQKYVYN